MVLLLKIYKLSKMKRIFFIFLFFSILNAYSQNIDSLIQEFNRTDLHNNPQKALKIINNIYSLTHNNEPYTAIEYLGRAIKIYESILLDSVQKYIVLTKIANIYIEIGNYDLALKYLLESKTFFEKKKDQLNLANTLFNLGSLYKNLEISQLALDNFFKAKNLFNNANDYNKVAEVNIQISDLYSFIYNLDSALYYINISFKLPDINNKTISNLFKALSDFYFLNNINYDTAIFYIDKAINFIEKHNLPEEVANLMLQKANILIEEENYAEAQIILKEILPIFEKYKSKNKIIDALTLMGISFLNQKQFQKSEQILLKALQIAENDNFLTDRKIKIYQTLSDLYSKQGNYQKSYYYLEQAFVSQQELFNQKTKTGFSEIIINIQNEEKLRKIELLQKERDLQTQKIKNQTIQLIAFGILSLMTIIFGIIIYIYLQRQKNINKILQAQNLEINKQKRELEAQSKILEKATNDLVRKNEELVEKTKKITSSINYASRIQKAMLPKEDLFKKYFDDYFIIYLPKEIVSGDFYWITELRSSKPSLFVDDSPENIIIIAVVDCTGHGVPGAFMSMLGEALLNQIVNILNITEPDKILYNLHISIRKALQQQETENNDGMDLALCKIDKNNKILEFAGAKNPIIYIQNDNLYKINGSLLPIGGLQKEKSRLFEKHTIDITATTYVYLFSDGFQDQFGGQYGRKYMAENFRNLIYKHYKLPFDQQKTLILQEFEDWKGKNYHQMDDVTIIGFKI